MICYFRCYNHEDAAVTGDETFGLTVSRNQLGCVERMWGPQGPWRPKDQICGARALDGQLHLLLRQPWMGTRWWGGVLMGNTKRLLGRGNAALNTSPGRHKSLHYNLEKDVQCSFNFTCPLLKTAVSFHNSAMPQRVVLPATSITEDGVKRFTQ